MLIFSECFQFVFQNSCLQDFNEPTIGAKALRNSENERVKEILNVFFFSS